jgi:agmatine/peptidylarginine deiminase
MTSQNDSQPETESKQLGTGEESSSSAAGYRWVAEWEKHEATWISWPHNHKTWIGKFESIPPVTERMVRILAEVEHVHVLGGNPEAQSQCEKALDGVPNVTLDRHSCFRRMEASWERRDGGSMLGETSTRTKKIRLHPN